MEGWWRAGGTGFLLHATDRSFMSHNPMSWQNSKPISFRHPFLTEVPTSANFSVYVAKTLRGEKNPHWCHRTRQYQIPRSSSAYTMWYKSSRAIAEWFVAAASDRAYPRMEIQQGTITMEVYCLWERHHRGQRLFSHSDQPTVFTHSVGSEHQSSGSLS